MFKELRTGEAPLNMISMGWGKGFACGETRLDSALHIVMCWRAEDHVVILPYQT